MADGYQRFEGMYPLKMEAAFHFETLLSTYQITGCHNTETAI
jgi:hypothetical protein